MDSVDGFSPNWMRYTRMKDFPKLEFLRVWFCALWTWESLKIANNFRASVLDLDVSTDIHFQDHYDSSPKAAYYKQIIYIGNRGCYFRYLIIYTYLLYYLLPGTNGTYIDNREKVLPAPQICEEILWFKSISGTLVYKLPNGRLVWHMGRH
ncbi:hypothetical protein C8Q69DRAFT_312651 [Paecilomyces variotii]|uniref:Uncharacterized protein n=1 Tax=Byssochlamys spectabilis TaxID=264951 RepID=A0A443HQ96_BYSSP|nr:hypothetical protein C8Q69DRAFT_312651 [Paecilomyces variotii]RWQ94008.1 hypothetical protein C8Q69DRAFT_312651 [Paecilomyces variotii]